MWWSSAALAEPLELCAVELGRGEARRRGAGRRSGRRRSRVVARVSPRRRRVTGTGKAAPLLLWRGRGAAVPGHFAPVSCFSKTSGRSFLSRRCAGTYCTPGCGGALPRRWSRSSYARWRLAAVGLSGGE
ncbi:hypothetical protein GQ55_5G336100 [Panicum hallii var. hallii]|uniref:Uncharacterized protein n=1 Tax=Panicum hallii var. hallii TaxID=1504633 RepID=A0A2T7DLY9_9POAL|nr:hypothetical protein GQ55_5G336100 [Panicum hallii var. hallii]